MKKWLMLAFLPLLLAQQEVGATPIRATTPPFIPINPSTGLSYPRAPGPDGFETLVAEVPGSNGFKAEFDFYDTNGDNTNAEGVGIGVFFGSNVFLNVAQKVVELNQQVLKDDVLLSPPQGQPNSLMQFFNSSLTMLALSTLSTNTIYIISIPTKTDSQLFYLQTNLMTTDYLYGGDATLAPAVGQSTCMRRQSDSSGPICALITTPVSVPTPNSLVLLGVGLLALNISPCRRKLFDIPL